MGPGALDGPEYQLSLRRPLGSTGASGLRLQILPELRPYLFWFMGQTSLIWGAFKGCVVANVVANVGSKVVEVLLAKLLRFRV